MLGCGIPITGEGACCRQALPFGRSAGCTLPRGPRPCPGRGSRLSLRESPDAKSRRGFPPAPPGIKPLAGARSLFWVACPLTRSLSGKSAPDQIWNRLFGEKHFTGSCSAKNPAKENPKKERPQIRARTWITIKRTAVPLRLYPKRWSERAASGFKIIRIQGEALGLFASGLSPRESPDPRPGQGRGTTPQGSTCDGPNGTASRGRPTEHRKRS